MKHYLYFYIFFIIISTGCSQDSSLKISLEVDDEDGILHEKNTIQAFLTIENTTERKIDFVTKWIILTDDWKQLKTLTLSHTVNPGQNLRTYCPLFRFPSHGFYRIRAEVTSSTSHDSVYEQVIGIDPEKINEPQDKKEDFYSFWDKALDELSKVDPEYKISPIKREDETNTKLFRVEMISYQGTTVSGWLEVPKKKGVYPALLRIPGYQENMEPIDVVNDMIVFSFNTRDHGESDDSEGGRNWDMWVRGLDSKDDYYYKGLFLDCIRALDFLTTQENVDTARIAIWGGSQGGGLSFSTAALDSRVALCITDIPYMCDYPNYFEITYWKEVSAWFDAHPNTTWETLLNTLSYYDTKNFADKINCPVWMGIGLQDDVCPPSTSFVTFNKVQSDKNYIVYKNERHRQPEEHYELRFKQLRQFFGMNDEIIKD
ncbi:MAG: acetylxylan esterase [Mariniphaga sp.]|nr:acetylxylan esterase [Mariniphaga sp.]